MGGQGSKTESETKSKQEIDSVSAYRFNNHLPLPTRKWQQCSLKVPEPPQFISQMHTDDSSLIDAQNTQNTGYFATLPSELIYEILSCLFENKKSRACKSIESGC